MDQDDDLDIKIGPAQLVDATHLGPGVRQPPADSMQHFEPRIDFVSPNCSLQQSLMKMW